MFKGKILQVANPFEALRFEQKNYDSKLDFRIPDSNTLCIKRDPTGSKIYT